MKREQNIFQVIFSLLLPALFLTGCSAGCDSKNAAQSTLPKSESSNSTPAVTAITTSPAPVAASAGATNASAPGISGKIILKGTPPPERNVAMDPACGALHPIPVKTRLYVVGNDGALGDVFVYVKEGLNGKTFPASDSPVLLDQVGCEYTPYVVGLQTNQKLLVRNSDPMMHNVHSLPKMAGNKESNRAQMAKTADLQFMIENPELFLAFKCEVHPWMYAYVCVVDNPFFTVSGKDGTFQLKNVPDGKYVIEAVHRKAGKQTKEVTVTNGASAPIDFSFEVPTSP